MQVNESSENYLETILMLSKTHPVVRSVDIATELNFKKSSVSVAMKKLREAHHIIVSPHPAWGRPGDCIRRCLQDGTCDQCGKF